jgi:hypothetical protein
MRFSVLTMSALPRPWQVIHDQARAEELAVQVFLKWWRNPQAHEEQAQGWLVGPPYVRCWTNQDAGHAGADSSAYSRSSARRPPTPEQESRLAPQAGLPGKELHLPVIWTSYQFPLPLPSCKLRLFQSKVRT